MRAFGDDLWALVSCCCCCSAQQKCSGPKSWKVNNQEVVRQQAGLPYLSDSAHTVLIPFPVGPLPGGPRRPQVYGRGLWAPQFACGRVADEGSHLTPGLLLLSQELSLSLIQPPPQLPCAETSP